jgi:type II secretory pathway component PulL
VSNAIAHDDIVADVDDAHIIVTDVDTDNEKKDMIVYPEPTLPKYLTPSQVQALIDKAIANI